MSFSQVSDCRDHDFLLIRIFKAQVLRVPELMVAFIGPLQGRGGGISAEAGNNRVSNLKGQTLFHAKWLPHLANSAGPYEH